MQSIHRLELQLQDERYRLDCEFTDKMRNEKHRLDLEVNDRCQQEKLRTEKFYLDKLEQQRMDFESEKHRLESEVVARERSKFDEKFQFELHEQQRKQLLDLNNETARKLQDKELELRRDFDLQKQTLLQKYENDKKELEFVLTERLSQSEKNANSREQELLKIGEELQIEFEYELQKYRTRTNALQISSA